ncbi:Rieske 2Fe-2S domain-containing protein [Acidithiobacillus caldus ATCC 51756]|nr:Rieske 2Fe-2S domain-containing protein [Acidithiobacillus caldus]MBU2735718.1 Rieske 2Fe-2S domain-containing protein [Acidithiobacillus caldus ATCC 51756]MBU2744699.1 Rieske 2Fe-2S domain-containing protein [Acidithiobacillus caldus]MBU2763972.1 Rieske 2Fe-2S domain-containing protein [Acidithiobacillus caldus]MBU2769832.1 Rieske 2Fe-2S domain-containing protein [Acidithiobacillus caldus]
MIDCRDLDVDLAQIGSLEKVLDGWDETQKRTVNALLNAWEDVYREAFRRLIRSLRENPETLVVLRGAAQDPYLYAVLRSLGLVKASLQERIESALDGVRPSLEGHGGNVELVEVRPPDTVVLRLLGSCHGCPSSSLTLSEGVERAIREACPEIVHIETANQNITKTAEPSSGIQYISPFAITGRHRWVSLFPLSDLPVRQTISREFGRESLIFWRNKQDVVRCYRNACGHLGLPLDGGDVNRDGVLTCPAHGFRFHLDSGECLTVPEIQLDVRAVRVLNGMVQVRKED